MLNDLAADAQVYLVTGYTDLRRGIDGLATIIQAQLNLDPFSKALFLFCGRRCDRIKGLLWATVFCCCTNDLTTEDSSGRAVRPKP